MEKTEINYSHYLAAYHTGHDQQKKAPAIENTKFNFCSTIIKTFDLPLLTMSTNVPMIPPIIFIPQERTVALLFDC